MLKLLAGPLTDHCWCGIGIVRVLLPKRAMGPSLSQTLQTLPNVAPATGSLTVTCNSVSKSQCVNWTITPNTATGSSNPPTVADLFYYAKSGKTGLQFVGQYYDTFRIDLTAP